MTSQILSTSDTNARPGRLFTTVTLCALMGVGVVLAYVQVTYSPLLALLLLAGIPVAVIMVTRPVFSLLLLVFAIPLERLNHIGALPAELSLFKVLSVAVFGGIIVHYLVFRRQDRWVSAPQNWWLALFVLAVLASGFVAVSPRRTLAGITRLARVLMLYPIVVNVIKSERDLHRVTWAFLLSGLICTLYGIYTYHFAPHLIEAEGRISGTMDDPNEFAAAMLTRIPLALELFLRDKRRWPRIVLAVVAGASVYGIVLSGSRSGLLALAVAFLLFVSNRKRKFRTFAIVIAVMALVFVVMPSSYQERMGLEPSTQETAWASMHRRWTYQVLGIQLFQKHPVLGIGLDGFAVAYGRSVYRFLQDTHVERVAHNTYLEIAVGVGLTGLIPLLGILATSMLDVRKVAQKAARPSGVTAIAKGIFASLGGFLVACVFLSEQYEKTLWLLVALAVVAQHLYRRSVDAQPR